MPRMMKVEPLDSTMLVPLMCRPVAAKAGPVKVSTDATSAMTTAPIRVSCLFMTCLGKGETSPQPAADRQRARPRDVSRHAETYRLHRPPSIESAPGDKSQAAD